MKENGKQTRTLIRAERLDTASGSIGHMTVDEIKARSIGNSINASCPECGRIHLTREEVEQAEMERITGGSAYANILREAILWPFESDRKGTRPL
jgi:hypothetical protein